MLEKHKVQNEAWLKARAEENDKEKEELFKLRVNIYKTQEKGRDWQVSQHFLILFPELLLMFNIKQLPRTKFQPCKINIVPMFQN